MRIRDVYMNGVDSGMSLKFKMDNCGEVLIIGSVINLSIVSDVNDYIRVV